MVLENQEFHVNLISYGRYNFVDYFRISVLDMKKWEFFENISVQAKLEGQSVATLFTCTKL